MNQQQRFCPLCDRAFSEGEAVLRCEGCGVMHHPSCWVTHGGCATETEHRVAPSALAYSTSRSSTDETPHAGEGIRVIGSPAEATPRDAARGPIPLRPAGQRPATVPPAEVVPEIGGQAPHSDAPHRVAAQGVPPPAPRRYVAAPDLGASRKPLPRIYGHHRILAYWYVPVAVALAAIVAFGVVWIAERLSGDGESNEPAAMTTPASNVTTATAPATGSQTPGPGTTATVRTSPSAVTGAAKFRAGDVAVVTGTGDCLNVRTAAGRSNDAIVCLPDGSEVTVIGGPEVNGDLRWWKLKTASGEGWAVEDYLVRKP